MIVQKKTLKTDYTTNDYFMKKKENKEREFLHRITWLFITSLNWVRWLTLMGIKK